MNINELLTRAESGRELSTKEQFLVALSGLTEIDDVERVDFFDADNQPVGKILNAEETYGK